MAAASATCSGALRGRRWPAPLPGGAGLEDGEEVQGLRRVLDPTSIASVAYGEIGSSIFFALGVVALQALGFTPWVLAGGGRPVHARGGVLRRGHCGDTGNRRRCDIRPPGLQRPGGIHHGLGPFLDYLIVIALAGLFTAHYLGHAVGWEALTDSPWDVVVGIGVIFLLGIVRLVRRADLYRLAVVVAGLAFVTHFLIVGLGFAFLVSSDALSRGVDLGRAPTWGAIAFALPLAMLAYTGLETVANLAAETREPGRTLPRSLFAGIGLAVVMSVAIGIVGISAYPAHPDPAGPGGFATDLGTTWIRAPIVGIAVAFGGELPDLAVDVLRIFLGLSGCVDPPRRRLHLDLRRRAARLLAGAARNAPARVRPAEQADADRSGVDCDRRPFSSALLLAAVLVGAAGAVPCEPLQLRSPLAFTAAQLAVIRLRFTEPELERPFRALVNVSLAWDAVPLAALIGAPLTFVIWIAALLTHDAARVAGPIWLVLGFVVFASCAAPAARRLLERVQPAQPDLVPEEEGALRTILVPLKLGPIGDEVLATALRLAEEQRLRGARPERHPGAARAAARRRARRAGAAMRKVRSPKPRRWLPSTASRSRDDIVRARAIGEAIVEHAHAKKADLVIMGSVAALAPPVPLLQPDRRLRPEARALRGHGRRLSPRRPGRNYVEP